MADTKCRCCGKSNFKNNQCVSCGAIGSETVDTKQRWTRGEPFEMRGFVVWPLADYSRDVVRYQFYTGRDKIAEIPISRDMVDEYRSGDYAIDIEPLIWNLFLLACGDEQEYIMSLSEKNQRVKPAKFKVTLVKDDSETFYSGIRRADFEIAKRMAYANG